MMATTATFSSTCMGDPDAYSGLSAFFRRRASGGSSQNTLRHSLFAHVLGLGRPSQAGQICEQRLQIHARIVVVGIEFISNQGLMDWDANYNISIQM